MAMDKINGSPLPRQGLLERFRGTGKSTNLPVDGGVAAADKPKSGAAGDRAEISDAARRLVDLRQAVDTGRAALALLPDPRPEKVAAARERLATGFYQSAEVRQTVAGRVAGVLEGLDQL